ncbi:PadR family transcriptional regulator [uncultured Paludibaculum sp.]|uniref:PadR family transcriptional regulator n=1 Tax=uncultured Paludibaculum sp. TaxID=1765020 RepID=UPI002AAB0EE1|nr:PadR family transcriptional regulator [uncultured Paludibaculum sp.]
MSKPSDLIHGTLDLLILNTISLEPKHGWAIAKRIQQVSNEVLQISQGALYPALHRLEQQGWIRSEWRVTDGGRDAKYYTLTKAGRIQLVKELEQWERLSTAVGLAIRLAPEAAS